MNIGSIILFGRPNGEQTLGRILKVNSKTFKVQTLEARGSRSSGGVVWTVAKSLCRPVDTSLLLRRDLPAHDALARLGLTNEAADQRREAMASLNRAAQTDLVASAMRKLTRQELAALEEHFKKFS